MSVGGDSLNVLVFIQVKHSLECPQEGAVATDRDTVADRRQCAFVPLLSFVNIWPLKLETFTCKRWHLSQIGVRGGRWSDV